jgi:DNA-binding transcriptional LysR family regulator
MLIDGLNLNYIRIFDAVYRAKSMTKAAAELHMTQSGVSQHIKALEEMIGVKLFDRVQKRLVPTAKATLLHVRCETGLSEIESGLGEIKETTNELRGIVSLGMPIEFANSIVLPKMGKFCIQHPKVNFRFRIALAPMINELLIKGELDFAFVDDFVHDRRIETEEVYHEVLNLYAHESLVKTSGKPKTKGSPKDQLRYFEGLQYVDYQDTGTVLRAWFSHHFKERNPRFSLRGTILDVQGVARLIASGAGAGVLPSHVADRMIDEGIALHCYPGSGRPRKNVISLASLRGRSQSPASLAVIEHLKSSF